MKAIRTSTLAAIIVATLSLAFVGPAASQPYLWGGMGSAKADLRTTPDVSGRETGVFELGAGYRFNRYVGIEAGYFDLPLYDTGSPVNPAQPPPPPRLNADWTASGFTVAVVGLLPVSSKWSLIGKAGVLRAESEFKTITVPAGNVTVTERKLGSRPMFGAGFQFEVDPHFSLRALYQRIEGKGGSELDSLDTVSLGMVIQF